MKLTYISAFVVWSMMATASAIPMTLGEDMSASVKKLIGESEKKKMIFGSAVFNDCRLENADLEAAVTFVKSHTDYKSYHLLLAIRRDSLDSYKKITSKQKVAVLTSALRTIGSMNDWSYLDPSTQVDKVCADCILELGKDALPSLTPILDDATRVGLAGSKAATSSVKFQYRRKDFAYRYIMLIRSQQPTFYADPKERDKDIEALKAQLKKDAK